MPMCNLIPVLKQYGCVFCNVGIRDKVLGMDLSQGGHLTHGSPVNISGKYFTFFDYGVNKETEKQSIMMSFWNVLKKCVQR